LSFDFAQDGEPVEPFRISDFVLRIWSFFSLHKAEPLNSDLALRTRFSMLK